MIKVTVISYGKDWHNEKIKVYQECMPESADKDTSYGIRLSASLHACILLSSQGHDRENDWETVPDWRRQKKHDN